MVPGTAGAPVDPGSGRIFRRCLHDEIRVQSQSQFPFVSSSALWALCSPNRLALAPSTTPSAQMTSVYSSHPEQSCSQGPVVGVVGETLAGIRLLTQLRPDSHRPPRLIGVGLGSALQGAVPRRGCALHRGGRALDKANVVRSSRYSNWVGYGVPPALSQEQTSWSQGALHKRPQLVWLLQSPGSFSAAQDNCGCLACGFSTVGCG